MGFTQISENQIFADAYEEEEVALSLYTKIRQHVTLFLVCVSWCLGQCALFREQGLFLFLGPSLFPQSHLIIVVITVVMFPHGPMSVDH